MSNVISEKPQLSAETRVSSYEKLSAMLVAAISILGSLVFLMFLVWLTMGVNWSNWNNDGIKLTPVGNLDRPDGVELDWQPPGVVEFPEVDKPQLADALEATSLAISRIPARDEKFEGDANEMGIGIRYGDKRIPGIDDGSLVVVPEADRWKIELVATSKGEYMKILEGFDITIGVVHELSNLIEYVDDLTAVKSTVEQDERKNEARLFFMNQKNRLRHWDRSKAESVGLELKNTLVGHFYSPELREQMLAIEQAVIERDGKDLEEVKKTEFRIRPTESGYEYYIPDNGIEYRPKPKRPLA